MFFITFCSDDVVWVIDDAPFGLFSLVEVFSFEAFKTILSVLSSLNFISPLLLVV